MSQENIEVVRKAYEALTDRDFDALRELADPDWVFDFSRSMGPQKGVYRDAVGRPGRASISCRREEEDRLKGE